MEIHDLNRTDCWEFLGPRRLGRLGCARDNRPYVVPVSFAIRSPYIVAFTTLGKKVEYLRANPFVCIQFDEILSPQSWTSVIAEGEFEELSEERAQSDAHQLLEKAVWWEPGYVRTTVHGQLRPMAPIYFRVFVNSIAGRRGVPDST